MTNPAPLEDWLLDSINGGCTLPSMVDAMIESGHPEHEALLTVAEAFARHRPEALAMLQHSPEGRALFDVLQGREPDLTAIAPAAEVLPILDPATLEENLLQLSDRAVPVLLTCLSPRLALLGDLLSAQECETLIAASAHKLERSQVVDGNRPGAFIDDARTSYGTYFEKGEHPLADALQQRLSEMVRWPLSRAEPLQILHYPTGGEYVPHFDYFDSSPAADGSSPLNEGGQRIATVVIYLSDVPAGGGTIFPQMGLEVRPRRGSALYFSYRRPDGSTDPASLHGGAPVLRGEKWIATQWFREGNFIES